MSTFVIAEFALFGGFFAGAMTSAIASRRWGAAPLLTIRIFAAGAALMLGGATLFAFVTS